MALRPVLTWLGAVAVVTVAAWTVAQNTRPQALLAGEADPKGQPAKAAQPEAKQPAEDPAFKAKVLPFIKKYCLDCHSGEKAKGGLTLEGYTSEAHARKDRKNWLAVQHVLASGEMPPKN